MPPRISISPPLLNTATPWATTHDDLAALYALPHTGAVTTRTALLTHGFDEDPLLHQHAFIAPSSSVNTYGYSPYPLSHYLSFISSILSDASPPPQSQSQSQEQGQGQKKPFIVSVTGTAAEVRVCVAGVSRWAARMVPAVTVYVEVNLSCPNIPDKPPPAYSSAALREYLSALHELQTAVAASTAARGGRDGGGDGDGEGEVRGEVKGGGDIKGIPEIVPVGFKTPPYTYQAQFDELLSAIEEFPSVLSFITATNTLGNALFLAPSAATGTDTPPDEGNGGMRPVVSGASGTGIAGLAGESIHPLSLGNVFTIRKMLDASEKEEVRDIVIIGAGGVGDAEGYRRMRAAGAAAVGVGTALGRDGVGVFERILDSTV
ncbi:hypothetical protein Dda_3061 [Drechslerella dactyloides]|uniref:Dihydroorotate dehydrogenase catalytic domain-containing protein n=1 Tax=Drechslerella dactyloides TaxID=74499 RepID=A0AAD6NLE8_DREDA|nr:hypothetical protein Dda_3061 [Drechslerella dactyloides]